MKCQNCEGTIVYPQGLAGEKICNSCGLVIDDTPVIQAFTQWAPEWYSNWNEQDSETIKEWLTVLRSVSCQLSVPNFPYREEAARTIRRQSNILSHSQRLSKNKRATVAALMHIILKEYDKTRPIKEISKELGLDNRALMKYTWILNKTLTIKKERLKTPRKTAIDYLHEYAGKLTDSKELILHAESTLLLIRRAGGNPIGLAAGAFYNTCKQKKTKISKDKIGETFKISDRTVYTNEARIRSLVAAKTAKNSAAIFI